MAGPTFVGVDLRVHPDQLGAAWTLERRRQYLLRLDVPLPLSVDPMVWPSRFWQPHVPPGAGIPRRLGTVAVPTGTPGYTALGLWRDVDDLERFRSDHALPIGRDWLVGVVAWPGDDPSRRTVDDLSPKLDGWITLGFDVADSSFVSGLLNCGYAVDEREWLAATWGPRLNEHGLLASLDEASAFVELTDERVPEHAPFLVFELRRPR
jgi:hypothetical protein